MTDSPRAIVAAQDGADEVVLGAVGRVLALRQVGQARLNLLDVDAGVACALLQRLKTV
jgi:hypothetical protein